MDQQTIHEVQVHFNTADRMGQIQYSTVMDANEREGKEKKKSIFI